ncbi:DUF6503 family protein [Ichthyenterobacterium sp. W332]|uniref:DUF6503 family protein n=1 Tax=Microcosmobacter mediterraneus TaxID=3075607 RepID=A0ABU2YJP1_9FLAO|nr:DUF6503 family protein [Ichthyenterobacterium sp. W332]MDT0557455.1 DUF6503 family protein [Ichthyenterobacterium sp. W332]
MRYLVVIFSLVLFACNEKPKSKSLSADDIVNKSIAISGGEKFGNSKIEFDFRDKHYLAKRSKGNFILTRAFKIDEDSVFDILSNEGFERFINADFIKLPDSTKVKYTASVNSVHYFSVLPYGLNDGAVNKKLLRGVTVKGQPYYKINVTFNEDGGGEDFEDVFIYWINKNTFKVDYLAYSYNEDDGKGLRFRESYNERTTNGLRFVDYNNYKPKDNTIVLSNLDQLFETDSLILLSKIELENISVDLINN